MSQTTDPKPCPNRPRAGVFKDHPCLREEGHPGGHCYTADTLERTLAEEAKHRPISDDDLLGAFTHADIAERAQALDETQTLFEGARFKAMPKIPCPTCTGNGQVIGGSLGDACDTCFGKRVIQDDSVPFIFEMPDFNALRGPVVAYGNALVWREYGKEVALPERSSVPDLATIEALRAKALEAHRFLGTGSPTPNLLPPATAPARSGFETEGGIDRTAADKELDEIEDAIVLEGDEGSP